jgi:beta-alanine--pyruvate transaminase
VLVRATADILAISPPLIISRGQIDELFGTLGEVIKSVD